uniref:Uncharacterized protein n=1 Tax=Cucumis melo TaxID=3656 RepID=A0A9I9E784_CUCME
MSSIHIYKFLANKCERLVNKLGLEADGLADDAPKMHHVEEAFVKMLMFSKEENWEIMGRRLEIVLSCTNIRSIYL